VLHPFQGSLGIMGRFVIVAGMVLVVGVLVARMADQPRTAPVSSNVASSASTAASRSPPASASNSRSVTISRGRGGHFWTDARVDGRRLELVVDTGATTIALRASDAARLGIHPAARDYSIQVATANGITRAAMVQLRMVEVGNIVVRDVPALVHADDALGVNLLGMSFLSKLRWTHDRGKLILEQ
jgi:aspartyl protease family protein